ncbi:MAG: polysaccharide biosynthesis tyrosine autokinase [Prolixibacteraceae bacterium]|nr:polysaccharide biosynthesis tyrosine autokinase [Prolixibacteraceae bacterium]
MNNTTNINDVNSQDEGIDVKKIIYLLLRQWHWLALFAAIGLIGAFSYTKLTKPVYIVSTSVLVPEKSNGLDMRELFQGTAGTTNNNIFNQIEIIKSYYNVNQTLINLNWRTSWYSKGLFVWRGIYKQEPFDVQETPNFINPKGIAIYITPGSGDNYTVKVEGKIYQNNAISDVKFESSGTYGRPFENKYFKFTLLKKVNNFETPTGNYYFVFNDLNDITMSYMGRLSASLKDKKGDIIVCSIQGEDPNREVDFLNELIRVYTAGKMDFQNEAQRRSLDFINTQLAGISDSLNTAGTKFTEFRSQNNIIDLGAEGTLVMNNLTEIESERARAQMQLDYFQDLLKYLNNASELNQLVAPSVVGIQDASLNALVLKLGELYNRRQVISFSAKENNPTLVMIDKELNQTRTQLNENLRNLIDNATRNINSQKERQDRISVQLNKLPQKEQKMVNIQRQFNLTNDLYTFLLQKRAETNISLASSIPDVQVIDIARPELAYEIGLGRIKIMMIGLILGLSFPLAYILVLGYFDNRIRTQTDLERNTTIPILGNIMHSPSKSDLIVHENPKSNIAESFRALRTNLQYMLTGPGGKVISVHSTNPGEGKSFSSINLASILAVNNKKVLLIGADMRKPRLHKVFKLPNEKGLSTYLIGNDSIDQVIISTFIENLSLLPSGPIPPNPAEILNKPEMKILLDEVCNQFDYIIIDNAPTSMVTDGHIVSHFSDLNIFILRYGISHKHQIEIINQYVDQKTIGNVAILVNDIKMNAFGHSYYKYYQYEAYQNTYYSDEKQETKSHRKKKIA